VTSSPAGHRRCASSPAASGPTPGVQLTLFEAEDGSLQPVGHQPARAHPGRRGQPAYIDAAHRVHARAEDAIRAGKDTGIGKFPSHQLSLNRAWFTAALTAAALLAWLRLLALDGDLAKAEPKTLRPVTGSCTPPVA
jgi:hypothetical protein